MLLTVLRKQSMFIKAHEIIKRMPGFYKRNLKMTRGKRKMMPMEDREQEKGAGWEHQSVHFIFFILKDSESVHTPLISDVTLKIKHILNTK